VQVLDEASAAVASMEAQEWQEVVKSSIVEAERVSKAAGKAAEAAGVPQVHGASQVLQLSTVLPDEVLSKY
jgi:hypothetical protein